MSVIQQVYLAEAGYSIYIKGIKPDKDNARRVLESSEREKVCQYCHNHEFDAILEVHHLKGILEFDEDTLIKEINNENNLVWLCPNHHIMLEKGLISLE